MTGRDKRNHTIDVIKGIAIILVLITHYEWTPDQRRIIFFPYVVNMAIPIFMVITGYVYSLSLSHKRISHIEEAYTWPLILKRMARYTLPLIFVILWELYDPKFHVSKAPLDILRWIIVGTEGAGNYYYPVMVQLVFLFPIIFCIIEYKREKGLYICLAINALYELLAWAYHLNTETYRLLVFRYIFLISAGVFAFKGYSLKRYTIIAMTGLGAAFITAITYLGYEPKIVNGPWSSTNCLSSMMIVPLMIWVLQKVSIRCAPLEIVGKASYHIFLVQMMYYRGYYGELQSYIPKWQMHLAAGIGVCLVVGIIFFFIEKPLQNRIRTKIVSTVQAADIMD